MIATAASVFLGAQGSALVWLAVGLGGVAVVGSFPALHETGHASAFANGRLNELVFWISAMLMLESPSFFREFHWQHHRHTQDVENDPEISSAPRIMDPWPSNPFTYLLLVNGQVLMFGKMVLTIAGALLPMSYWDRVFRYIRPHKRSLIAWECRLVVLVWTVVLVVGFRFLPGFGYALLAWPVAHVLLGFYLLAEHTGLPHDGSQIHRTRTIVSNAVIRWWMWNMPLHGVHHAHSAIPFHAVPRANARIRPDLENVSPGYLAFHREALRHAFRLTTAASSRS